MKRFLRSAAGKTTTFILCIICLCLVMVSVFAANIMITKLSVYTRSEKELQDEAVLSKIRSQAEILISDSVQYKVKNINENANVTDPQNIILEYGYKVPDKGNLIFNITDGAGKVLSQSESAADTDHWDYSEAFAVHYDAYRIYECISADRSESDTKNTIVILNVSAKEGLPETDSLHLTAKLLHAAYSMRYAVYIIGGLSFLLMIICFVILMCVSARKPGDEELHPGPLNKMPADLMLAAVLAAGLIVIHILGSTFRIFNSPADLIILVMAVLYAALLLGFCMSISARIKQKNLLKNTIIYYIIKGIGKLPLIWKTVLAVLAGTVVHYLLMALGVKNQDYFLISVLETIIIIPVIFYIAWCMRRLLNSAKQMAEGDIDHKTDTKGLFWDLKKHGEDLNRIADGMNEAVNKQLKSERMKTELITNVSHDIKTPLTSVINYAGLIAQQPCENEKISEYTEVLIRQSEKLKKLIEDLVEASKASTGNMELELEPCNAGVLLSQVAGEYEEKLKSAELDPVISFPDESISILADGRRMWRIFDNLLNNICKYSLSGTRVYISLERKEDKAVFTFRNTSRDPLNISEEELMERFTRGDSSRNTEGNGLGLSIAGSLAGLQHGELSIKIDGDLFKTELVFPIIR